MTLFGSSYRDLLTETAAPTTRKSEDDPLQPANAKLVVEDKGNEVFVGEPAAAAPTAGKTEEVSAIQADRIDAVFERRRKKGKGKNRTDTMVTELKEQVDSAPAMSATAEGTTTPQQQPQPQPPPAVEQKKEPSFCPLPAWSLRRNFTEQPVLVFGGSNQPFSPVCKVHDPTCASELEIDFSLGGVGWGLIRRFESFFLTKSFSVESS